MTSVGNLLPQNQFNDHSSQIHVYKGILKERRVVTFQKQRRDLTLNSEEIRKLLIYSSDGGHENIKTRGTYFQDVIRGIYISYSLNICREFLREGLWCEQSDIEPFSVSTGVSVKIIEKDGKKYFQCLPDGNEIEISPYIPADDRERIRKGLEIYFKNKKEFESDHFGKIAIIRSSNEVEFVDDWLKASEGKKPYLVRVKVGTISIGRKHRG